MNKSKQNELDGSAKDSKLWQEGERALGDRPSESSVEPPFEETDECNDLPRKIKASIRFLNCSIAPARDVQSRSRSRGGAIRCSLSREQRVA
jgi:hypothetical protein